MPAACIQRIDFCCVYTTFFVILRHVVDLFNYRSPKLFFFLMSGYIAWQSRAGVRLARWVSAYAWAPVLGVATTVAKLGPAAYFVCVTHYPILDMVRNTLIGSIVGHLNPRAVPGAALLYLRHLHRVLLPHPPRLFPHLCPLQVISRIRHEYVFR